ncbi:MAG: sugar ABC transporter ATP-binding protein [Planctomycetota bacterium]|nr:MAG: sugar ABC transporter ATP-binding protein [Planctomycetota bacterium]
MDAPLHGREARTLLCLRGISKSFGAVAALRDVSLDLRPGEVHALVGENGAGKSTLIKVITGAHAPDAGTLEIQGRRVESHSPRRARELGVAVIYQQPALFGELTVAENLLIGSDGPLLDWRARRRRAAELLARVEAGVDPGALVRELAPAQQQLVEIARALRSEAPILILDEPTAVLARTESERLLQILLRLRERGAGILYISHRLEEVERIADRVSVLRDGRLVWSAPMAELTRPALVAHMVGRELAEPQARGAGAAGPVLLEVAGLTSREAGLHDISLQVRAGEIVGLGGLVGAGRTELARCLVGLAPFQGGEVRVGGGVIKPRSPKDALACGIACVPEDRRRHGVLPALDVSENLTLPRLEAHTRRGLLDREGELAFARRWIERLRIKVPSPQTEVAALSGGNQQKVALARWLACEPRVLVLDEPTQGIDVGGRQEIHGLILEAAAKGCAVLLISSDLPELLELSDRIVVLRRGRVAGALPRAGASQEAVMSLALGLEGAA